MFLASQLHRVVSQSPMTAPVTVVAKDDGTLFPLVVVSAGYRFNPEGLEIEVDPIGNEQLLAAVVKRLQSAPKSREVAVALTHIETAALWLKKGSTAELRAPSEKDDFNRGLEDAMAGKVMPIAETAAYLEGYQSYHPGGASSAPAALLSDSAAKQSAPTIATHKLIGVDLASAPDTHVETVATAPETTAEATPPVVEPAPETSQPVTEHAETLPPGAPGQ